MNVHYPAKPDKFEFDADVAGLFDNMALRSIPGYEYSYGMITGFTRSRYIPHYSQVWDFGTSTGRGLAAVMDGANHPYIRYMGCDISDPMLDQAQENCTWAEFVKHDLTQGLPAELERGNVSIAIYGWTLQFLEDKELRARLLRDTFDALAPGGVLFVMEKFADTGPFSSLLQDRYISWRRDNGYSLPEIQAKNRALKGAMFPWEVTDLMLAMSQVDKVASVTTLFRLYSFGGFAFCKSA